MANSRILRTIEESIRTKWLPVRFKQAFVKDNLRLGCGGSFSCHAVSNDKKIAALIYTCSYNSRPLRKIYSDICFLLLSPGIKKRLIVFTERELYNYFEEQQKKLKRVSSGVEFLLCDLDCELRKMLDEFKFTARQEVAGK